MVLIGAILNACKISQRQYCGAIHELEIDQKKPMEFGFNFEKWGIWLLLSFKKKMGHLKEKREKKKNAITMKRFIVFKVICVVGLGQKNLITCQKDVKIRRRNNYLMKILVVIMTIYF